MEDADVRSQIQGRYICVLAANELQSRGLGGRLSSDQATARKGRRIGVSYQAFRRAAYASGSGERAEQIAATRKKLCLLTFVSVAPPGASALNKSRRHCRPAPSRRINATTPEQA